MSNISPELSPDNRDRAPLSKNSAEEILSLALASHNEGRLDEAVEYYREFLDIVPGNAQALFNLGAIMQAAGALSGAIKNFRQVQKIDPDNFQVLYCLADCLRDQGNREEAITVYRRITELDHPFPDPYYNLGVIYYQQEEYDLAMDCYRQALKIDPSHADSLYNLGIIHFEKSEYAEAADSYEKALEIRPNDIDTLYNLAFTRAKQGHYEKAALHYYEAIELVPNDAELHNSLGSVLRKINEPKLAEVCYRQAVEIKPDYGSAWTNLATILQNLDQYDQAMECYSKAIEFGDHTESADYMMAALTGSNRQLSPRSYVRELYDGYAESFEKDLVEKLHYNTPELLKKLYLSLAGDVIRIRSGVDLGCGTGLAGNQFSAIVDKLIGVDLSEKMLEKAADRQIYDRLLCSDIVDFLEGGSDSGFDLVIAADVFIYLGELGPFFRSVRERIERDGYLLFSTEKLATDGDYRLLKTGRYAHSEAYIRSLAAKHGFKVQVCKEVDKLRKEKDKWLTGLLFALVKK
jgi:predicted TPR repeat methyltransferase